MAGKPVGAVQRHRPGCRLFERGRKKVKSVGKGKFGGGALAQTGQRQQRTGHLRGKAAAQCGQQWQRIGFNEVSPGQGGQGGLTLCRKERFDLAWFYTFASRCRDCPTPSAFLQPGCLP